jgi:hypothetical protein
MNPSHVTRVQQDNLRRGSSTMSAAAQQDALRRASSNMSSASDDSAASDESMRNNASIRVSITLIWHTWHVGLIFLFSSSCYLFTATMLTSINLCLNLPRWAAAALTAKQGACVDP